MLSPLFDLSELLFDICFWIKEMASPGEDQPWPLRITGRLETPVEMVWHEINE
ncbi:MAG: hypothetical protein HEQ39_09920 [Rhizobacter sp.]